MMMSEMLRSMTSPSYVPRESVCGQEQRQKTSSEPKYEDQKLTEVSLDDKCRGDLCIDLIIP